MLGGTAKPGEVDPLFMKVELTDQEVGQLVTFLRSLDSQLVGDIPAPGL
jgi:hypothetical protein